MKSVKDRVLSLILAFMMVFSNTVPTLAASGVTVADFTGSETVLKSGAEVNAGIKGLIGSEDLKVIARAGEKPSEDEQTVELAQSGSVVAWFEDGEPSESEAAAAVVEGDEDTGDIEVLAVTDKEDKGTLYIYSKAGTIYYGEDASGMFSEFPFLENIDALGGFDFSHVRTADRMFWGDSTLADPSAIEGYSAASLESAEEIFDYTGFVSEPSWYQEFLNRKAEEAEAAAKAQAEAEEAARKEAEEAAQKTEEEQVEEAEKADEKPEEAKDSKKDEDKSSDESEDKQEAVKDDASEDPAKEAAETVSEVPADAEDKEDAVIDELSDKEDEEINPEASEGEEADGEKKEDEVTFTEETSADADEANDATVERHDEINTTKDLKTDDVKLTNDESLTDEEACEKMYNALVKWADENGAEWIDIIDDGDIMELSEAEFLEFLETGVLPKTVVGVLKSVRKSGYWAKVDYGGGWNTKAYILYGDDGKRYTGICVVPSKYTPADGTYGAGGRGRLIECKDTLLTKILYYGFGGPGSKGHDPGLLVTHGAAATRAKQLYNLPGDPLYRANSTGPAVTSFIKTCKKLPDPPEGTRCYLMDTGSSDKQWFAFVTKEEFQYGSLKIKKTADGAAMVKGDNHYNFKAKFVLTSDETGKKIATITTDKKTGFSKIIDRLKAGTYTLKEVNAPKGMKIPTKWKNGVKIKIKPNSLTNVTVEDIAYKKGRVTVQKKDAVTDQNIGPVTYKIQEYNGSEYVDYLTNQQSDNKGKYTSPYLYETDENKGWFRIVETKAPENYSGDFSQRFNVTDNDFKKKNHWTRKITATNDKDDAKIYVQKVDEDSPSVILKDAEFKVQQYNKNSKSYVDFSPNKTMKFIEDTAANRAKYDYVNCYVAEVSVTKNNDGKFKVVETKAPKGFTGNYSKTALLTKSKNYILLKATNHKEYPKGNIELVKKDSETNAVITTGGTFKVYEWNAAKNKYKTSAIATLKFSSNKYVTTSPLEVRIKADAPAGTKADWNEGKFRIVEEKAPDGYINRDPATKKAYTWDVTFNNKNFNTPQLITLTKNNTPNEYTIEKVGPDGKVPVKAQFKFWTDGNGKKVSVNGAEKTIPADKNTGLLVDTKETTVGEATKELIALEKLPAGKYFYQETKVYTENFANPPSTVFSFTVNANGTISGKNSLTKVIKNYSTTEIEVNKVIKDNGEAVNGFPNGTEFGIFEWSVKRNAYKNAPVVKLVWSAAKSAFVDSSSGEPARLAHTDENNGKFRIKETASTPGYIRDDTAQEFTVEAKPALGAKKTFTFENKPNEFKIYKVDTEGNKLSGVKFTIWHETDASRRYTETSSDADGTIVKTHLIPGTWHFKEISTLQGYKLDPAEYTFYVQKSGKIVKYVTNEGVTTKQYVDEDSITVENKEEKRVRIVKKDAKTGLAYDAKTGFPRGTTFGIYEWNEAKGDYNDTPSNVVTFMNEQEIEDFKASLPHTGKKEAVLPKTGKVTLKIQYLKGNHVASGNNYTQTLNLDTGASTKYGILGTANSRFNFKMDSGYKIAAGMWALGSASSNITVISSDGASNGHVGVPESGEWTAKQLLNQLGLHGKTSGTYTVKLYTVAHTTVKYDGNGETSGDVTDQSLGYNMYYVYDYASGSKILRDKKLHTNRFKKTGYTFKNWNTKKDGSGTSFANQVVADPTKANAKWMSLTDKAAGATIYAQWTPITYKVKFHANGGTGSMSDQTLTYDKAAALTANAFSKTGYTFDGWAKTATGAKAYNDKASVKNLTTTAGDTINLYARWKANTYTIAFNKNGGTGSMANLSMTYDQSKNLTANAFSRTGYTFDGWAESATGAVKYTNQQSVKNLAASGTKTLYAHWKANKYTIKFNKNGGTGTMADLAMTYGTPKNLTNNTFTRTGYKFLGWATSNTATTAKYSNGQSVNNLTATNNGTVTLYAVWKDNNGDLIYDGNGADSGSVAPQTGIIAGSSVTIKENGFTRNGYEFDCWTQNSDGSGTKYQPGQSYTIAGLGTSGGDVTIYAHWKPIEYTITINDGFTETPTVVTYTVASDDYTLPVPNRPGFDFLGWTGTGIADTSPAVIIPKGSTGNRTYTAAWVETGFFVDDKTAELPVITKSKNNKGKFMAKELTFTGGYILDETPQYFTFDDADADGVINLEFKDEPNETTIKKVDFEGNPIANVVFDVWYDGSDVKESYTTDENGEILLTKLKPEIWHYQEVSAPSPFKVNPQIFNINVDPKNGKIIDVNNTVIAYNHTANDFSIQKVDSKNRDIAGVVFVITKPDGTSYEEATKPNGKILLTNMEDGVWHYRESENQTVPGLIIDTTDHTFEVRGGEVVSESPYAAIVNEYNYIEIYKEDMEGNKLAGATFRVWNDLEGENAFDEELETDNDGMIRKEQLADGTWHFQEIKAPEGYKITDDSVHDFTVAGSLIDGKTFLKATVQDRPTDITLRKVDKDDPESTLQGVKFEFWDENNNKKEAVTDEKGEIHFIGLKPGIYYYKEIETLPGYILDPEIHEVTISNEDNVITAENEKNHVELVKVDADTETPLENIEFEFSYEGEGVNPFAQQAKHVTDSAGVIEFSGLPAGSYQFKETKTDETHILLNKTFTFVVGTDGHISSDDAEASTEDGVRLTYTVENEGTTTFPVFVRKVDSSTGEVLKGAEFHLEEKDDSSETGWKAIDNASIFDEENEVYTFENEIEVTASNGGKFKIVEDKAPAGYVKNYEQEFSAEEAGETFETEAVNKENEVKILKKDQSGNTINDVTFDVWMTPADNSQADAPDAEDEYVNPVGEEPQEFTPEGGEIVLKGLTAGTYYFRENKVPEGFLPDIDLEGNMNVHTFVVNEDGYIVDGNDLKEEASFTVVDYEKPLSGSIEIVKKDEDGEIMDDVQFVVYPYDKETKAYLEDDEHAEAVAYDADSKSYKNVMPLEINENNLGRFKVVETSSREGYAADFSEEFAFDWTKPEEAGLKYETEIVNHKNELAVEKVDENGNALKDVEFTLKSIINEEDGTEGYEHTPDPEDEDDKAEEVFEKILITGENGEASIKEIPAGNYTLQETKGVPGYKMDDTVHYITVDDKGFIHEEGSAATKSGKWTVKAVNHSNKLTLLKKDSKDKDKVLEGAEFKIERYAGTDGASEGDVLETRTGVTGADGKVSFEKLADGVWYATETKAPEGYQLDSTPRQFLVDGGGIHIAFSDPLEAELVWTIFNGEDIEVNVKIEKIDKATREKLEGAEFSVYELVMPRETYDDMDGQEPYAKLVYKDGFYVTDRPLIGTTENQAKFLVKETKAPEGYRGNWSTIIDGYEKDLWEFTVANGNPVENESGNTLILYKYDADFQTEENEKIALNGAVFEFWKEGDEANKVRHTTGEACGELTEEERKGKIILENLDADTTYYYQEVKAPLGFRRDPNVHEIHVNKNGLIQHSNTPVYTEEVGNYHFFKLELMTGGVGRNGIYCIGGALLAAMAALAFAMTRKKKQKKQ